MRSHLLTIAVSMVTAIFAAGCASRLPGPSSKQEWLSFNEYLRRHTSGVGLSVPLPVVEIPQGIELHLNIAQKSGWPATENIDPTLRPLYESQVFEPVEDTVVKARTKCTLYLDLENLWISIDKKDWWELGGSLLPVWMEGSQITLASAPAEKVTLQVHTTCLFIIAPPARVEAKK